MTEAGNPSIAAIPSLSTALLDAPYSNVAEYLIFSVVDSSELVSSCVILRSSKMSTNPDCLNER